MNTAKESRTGRAIAIKGIAFYANLAACATDCSFCLLGRKRPERVPFARIAALIDRFIDWKLKCQPDFEVFHWIRYSYHYSLEDMRLWVALWKRLGRTPDLMIGGMPMMTAEQILRWLRERLELGIEEVHASFLGNAALHDSLCRRRGDYEYRWLFLHLAATLGMKLNVRFLLTQRTLPFLDEVMRRAGQIDARVLARHVSPLFYMGAGTSFEEERLDEATRNALCERPSPWARQANWKSEREWIREVLATQEPPEPVMLRLDPSADSMARLEHQTCQEILDGLRERTARAYAAIPSRGELARRMGDAGNTRIYALQNDIERLWLDRYLAQTPVAFERGLTHLSLVR